MKKFKLIKEYPESATLDSIFIPKKGYSSKYFTESKGKKIEISIFVLENYPEYFQKLEDDIELEYDLSYDDLINGNYYTTEYPNQGKYTFKQGYNIWYIHKYSHISYSDGDFRPSNGFDFFRKATEEEIKPLL